MAIDKEQFFRGGWINRGVFGRYLLIKEGRFIIGEDFFELGGFE
jgi:hypothetical protein